MPEFPTTVQAGQEDVPGSLTITNVSNGSQAVGNVTLNEITLAPACPTFDPDCPTGDPNVFDLSDTATGTPGTACEGTTFNVTQDPATGVATFTPVGGPVVLGPPSLANELDVCQINFTFDVESVPDQDSFPGTAGIQTNQIGFASGVHDDGTVGFGSGSDVTTVLQAAPAIVTQVSDAGVQAGEPFTDTATLSGLVNPVQGPGAGTVTFSLFGPNDPTCAGPDIYTGADRVVVGNGNYTSDPVVVTAPGTYFWVVTYTGDVNNAPVTSPCGAPNENVRVIDIDIDKTVTPLTQPAPTGTFTYQLVITNPTPFPLTITELNDDVYGDLFDPANPEVTNNNCAALEGTVIPPNSSTAPCTFVGQFTGNPGDTETDTATVLVTDVVTGATATASDDAVVGLVLPGAPAIAVDKVASPLQQEVPGGDFTFTVVVTNTGPVPITITELDDDIYGDLFDAANPNITNNTCDELEGDILAPGASTAPCSFVGEFESNVPASQTDVVTVVGVDQFGRTATDNDDAVVTLIQAPPPQINLVKTASPLEREAPGGDFTFTVVVSNPGPIPVTITSLDDNIYGNIGTEAIEAGDLPITANTCDDLIGDVLAAGGGSASCTFTGSFTGVAGASQTDIVTVVGTDQFGRTVTDNDDAVVTLTPAPAPAIQVDKTVTPGSLPVPGGDFTFTVVVTNTGPRPLTITSLNDNVYGNIGTEAIEAGDQAITGNTCDDLIGDVLAVGASATCTFVGNFTNATPASETDIVTVVGTDAAGTTVTDNDDAVVTLFQPTAPQIDLVKTADPLTRTVPGGDFTFTVVVTNPGTIPVTITQLNDNIYGNIGAPAFNGNCDELIGDVLAPGGSATCTFVGPFTNATPASQTDIVTVTGTGNGQTVTADDDATVSLTPRPPLTIVVEKTASPLSRPVPGGDFTFTVVVRNPGTVPLTITSLTDDIYGNIGAPSATSTCDDLIGTVLAAGASSAPCSFTRAFTNQTPASQTDVVTVVGTDQFGQTVTDDDDATVTLTPRPVPQVQVDKTVTPGTRVAPGGDFTFTVVVRNPGPVPVVITSLVDDVYGNLATRGEPNTCDDLIGDTLAAGASTAPCTFTASFTGVAGDTETDIVTVIVVDNFGQTATDNDDAVITLTPPPEAPGNPSIRVDKTATPGTRPEPGGTFTFNVVISNPSNVPLTITALTDDIYGNLATRSGANTCDDLINDALAAGASVSCSFEGTFTGKAGDRETDVVTVTGRDEDGDEVKDDDDATVSLVAPPAVPQPPAPPAPPAPKPPTGTLTRTGADFLPFTALALALISAGFVMRNRRPLTGSGQAADRRRRHR